MNRPYIICHMVISLDGKVTGDFLLDSGCSDATEVYYEINRNINANGFICGRVTMENSFTGCWYPDLDKYKPFEKTDYIPKEFSGFYAVAFDTSGNLGWKSNIIIDADGDPGYDGAQIIEVLSERVDERYLGYLREIKIPYVFAGKDKIDIETALIKLKSLLKIEKLLLEGGSIINGAFLRSGVVDELSLVVAPVVADKDGKPLFMDSFQTKFKLQKSGIQHNVVVLNYIKNSF